VGRAGTVDLEDDGLMQKQYGAIPYVRKEDGIHVILITSARGYWIFPKGQYEEDRGKRGTAELEAYEEAGVKGRLNRKLSYCTKVVIGNGDRVHLTLYPLEVKTICKTWKEDRRRERKLIPVAEAKLKITSAELLDCLEKFERDFII
jgi:8-oxo-dGTP pyrophosphatase MutT (NUDIX family)